MPTYQYRCTECGHDLEAVQKFSDAALTECPNCGGSLRKVFNAVGVVFKGSGFYRTDSRTGKGDGAGGGGKDKGDGKDTTGTKEKKDAKEPAAAKANGSGSAKQPAASGASSTGGSSST
jgi:putative FmdB family regulatory protein